MRLDLYWDVVHIHEDLPHQAYDTTDEVVKKPLTKKPIPHLKIYVGKLKSLPLWKWKEYYKINHEQNDLLNHAVLTAVIDIFTETRKNYYISLQYNEKYYAWRETEKCFWELDKVVNAAGACSSLDKSELTNTEKDNIYVQIKKGIDRTNTKKPYIDTNTKKPYIDIVCNIF